MANAVCGAYEFQKRICEAVGVDVHYTRRVILDLSVDEPTVTVYVEMYASGKILDVDLAHLGKAKIQILDKDGD